MRALLGWLHDGARFKRENNQRPGCVLIVDAWVKGEEMNRTALSALPIDPSLQSIQEWNNTIYRLTNNREYELSEMVIRLLRYCSRVALWFRKGGTDRTGYHLTMMLSWLCAVANRISLDLYKALVIHCAIVLPPDAPFAELQKEFKKRHLDTTLQSSALCLAEKVMAVASALEYYRETHDEIHQTDMARKMAQSLEALCDVAGHLGIKLSEEYELAFSNGCCKCGKIPCGCGYRADKVV
jgi:hypothetical protein